MGGLPGPAGAADNPAMPRLPVLRRFLCLATVPWLVGACAPGLDWREVRPAGAVLTAWLPCKPERREREVVLAGATVPLELLACSAEGTTWGIASTPWADAQRVDVALDALRAARVQALDGRETARTPLVLRGIAPRAGAARFTVEGRRPDGVPVIEHAVVFSHGGRVFHAAALGGAPSPQSLDTFFDNLVPRP